MAKCLQKETFTRAKSVLRRRFGADIRGQELVEFAFILPVLMTLLMGIFYMGRFISVYQALERAAREGARASLATSCATCGDAMNYAAGQTAINNALTAASLDYTQAGTTINAATLDLSDPTNYQVNGVTVTVNYPFRFNIPFDRRLDRRTFLITSVVTMRQEF